MRFRTIDSSAISFACGLLGELISRPPSRQLRQAACGGRA
jgi:hypothetical protein